MHEVREQVARCADEELMVACAQGDDRAFSALYDRYQDRVYGLVLRVLRCPAQSEEVAQEVSVEAWRTAPRFDPERGAAASWLLTLAHRRAVDRVRSEQSARERDERISNRDRQPEHDPVAETVDRREERDRVRSAFGELTDLQREAIKLAYHEGNTYREVAEELGVPLGTVKSRLRDGLMALREKLEERQMSSG